MTEKQRKGIDFVINNLKKKYPVVRRWTKAECPFFTLHIRIEIYNPIIEEDVYEMNAIVNTYYQLLPDEYCFMNNVWGDYKVRSPIHLVAF